MKDSNSKRPRVSVELVKQAKKGEATPGIYRDAKGVGLVLKIEEPGAHAPEGAVGGPARWVLRTTIKGKRRDLGLGSIKDVTLAEARGRADELRKEARAGKDPTAKPKAALAFADAAKKVHAMHKHSWKNGKHVDQWINTIKQYANPKIGQKDVSEIDASDVLAVLNPIWQKKAETARRLRQRIALVLDWAQVQGYRDKTMANAANTVRAVLPKQTVSAKHHEALPWKEVPKFLKAVRSSNSMGGLPPRP